MDEETVKETAEAVNEETTEGETAEEENTEKNEDNVTEETEASEEDAEAAEEEAEGTEEEAVEENTDKGNEKMTALGCTKVTVTAEEGAELYAEASKESEVVGHLDAGTEVWVTLTEDQTFGQIYSEDEEAAPQFISMEDAEVKTAEENETEEIKETEALTDEQMIELGYRKVRVLNENGVDVYASTEEDAEAVDHIDFEKEIWIKDDEAEGWAEIFTEEETKTFVKLAEIDIQLTFEEKMLADGYYKVVVILEIGNEVYTAPDENSEIVETLPTGTELWIKPLENNWASIYSEDEEAGERFVYLADMAAMLTPEGAPELPIRSLITTMNTPERGFFFDGEEVIITVELKDFLENDRYDVKWMYSPDERETFIDIEDAHDLTYSYIMNEENEEYIYRIVVTLLPKE